MGTLGEHRGGPYDPIPFLHRPIEALNAQLSAAERRASAPQGSLPTIAPRPTGHYDYSRAAQIPFFGGYPGLQRSNSTASFGPRTNHPQYNMNAGPSRQFYPEPYRHFEMTASPTQMSQPDPFNFQIPPQQHIMSFMLPERRRTAYARMERPVLSPTVPFTPSILQPRPAEFDRSEEAQVWDLDEDNVSSDSGDEEISIGGIAGLDAHNIGPLVANNLHPPLDLYGTQLRSFHSLADANVLVNYVPSPKDTLLNNPKTAAVFWYFVTVTGPALNPYERNRIDPSRIFSNEPIPKSHQHIWSCKSAGPPFSCRRIAEPIQMCLRSSHSSIRPSFKQFSPWVACRWLSYQGILRLLHGCIMASVSGGTPRIIRARVGEPSRRAWLPHCCLLSMKSGSRTTRNGAPT